MKRLACHADCCPARRVYRGAVKKQKRYSALKLPIAVDSQTAMFAYIDPGNETASGLRFWGKGNQSEAKPCHRKSTAISVDPWEASRYLSFSLHIHHATGGAGSREDVSGIDKGRDPVVPGLSRSSEGGVIRRDEGGVQCCVEPAAEAISGFCFPGFTLKKGLASCPLWLVWVCFGFWLIYSQE